jgi:hypothetical protein
MSDIFMQPILLVEVIFLACEGVFYLMLAILLDKWSSNPRMVSSWRKFARTVTCRCLCSKEKDADQNLTENLEISEDSDVLREQHRVLEGLAKDDLVVIEDLTKIYDNGKVAVNHFSLGLSGGIFGLLGVNGERLIDS